MWIHLRLGALTLVQWWWTSMVPSITWPMALTPERSVKMSVHPGDEAQALVMAQEVQALPVKELQFSELAGSSA